MTTATLFSNISYDQNAAGPTVPVNTVVNTGGLITKASFTLTVSPSAAWADVAVSYGPDGVNFPGSITIYDMPGAPTGIADDRRFHAGVNEPSNTKDGAQYFQATLTNIAPGATATLTMTY